MTVTLFMQPKLQSYKYEPQIEVPKWHREKIFAFNTGKNWNLETLNWEILYTI